MKNTDKARLDFYHGAILRFNAKMDSLYLARKVYYSRSLKTPKRFRAAIDAAMRVAAKVNK